MAMTAAQLLDELMGKDRNLVPGEKSAQVPWSHQDVCRSYICGFCPHDLFVNTKADLGTCSKIHDDQLKAEYDQSSRYGKMGYEEEFIRYLTTIQADVDRKIRRGHERLMMNQARERELSEKDTDKTKSLNDHINQLLEEIEQLGTEGKVEEAQGVVKLVEQLKEEREQGKQNHSGVGSQEKQMEVCEVCGAFLIVGDAQSRVDDHLQGKQHVGYAKIKSTIEDMKERSWLMKNTDKKDRDDKDKDRDDKNKDRDDKNKDRDDKDKDRDDKDKDKERERRRDRSVDKSSDRRRRSKSKSRERRRNKSPERKRSRERSDRDRKDRDRSDRDRGDRERGDRRDKDRDRERERRRGDRDRDRDRDSRRRSHRSRSRSRRRSRSSERKSRNSSRDSRKERRSSRERTRDENRASREKSETKDEERRPEVDEEDEKTILNGDGDERLREEMKDQDTSNEQKGIPQSNFNTNSIENCKEKSTTAEGDNEGSTTKQRELEVTTMEY